MSNKKELKEKHSLLNDAIFRFKTYLLSFRQLLINVLKPRRKFHLSDNLFDAPIISESISELWNKNDNTDNWILTAGKIENLRIASRKLNGLVVKADETFSFWKHIGNPNIGKGYVIGREIREGCIVPTKAGGLCQLSNALYDAARKSNFEIIERHRHTKVVKGSLAELDRDATVKWNYIDLQFKAKIDFRIEVELTRNDFILRFRSNDKISEKNFENESERNTHIINDCYSCGNTSCFKHPKKATKKQENVKTCYILDDCWPEFDDFLKDKIQPEDHVILPFKKNKIIKTNRFNWELTKKTENVHFLNFPAFKRSLALRKANKQNKNIFEETLIQNKNLSNSISSKIPIECTHLVISQCFLPFLHDLNILGGRGYDVLMTQLPLHILQEKLDIASSNYPESKTLNDFRAKTKYVLTEKLALNEAEKLISPHNEIKKIYTNKIIGLEWNKETQKDILMDVNGAILFPSSTVGRKGAYTVREIARRENKKVLVQGRIIESVDFWEGIEVEQFSGQAVSKIVYPAIVENQPRRVLSYIDSGIPIYLSKECGISESENVFILNK